MIFKEILSETINIQKEIILSTKTGVRRELLSKVKLIEGFASVIAGIRRCGKSTLLRQLISNQVKFNYLNFEDVRIFGFDLQDFKRLDEIFDENSQTNIYFFDEIQNVEGWERYVRNLLDNKNIIVITGSNASLLSKELGSKLTGRHIRHELYPFSFNEFLEFKKAKPSLKNFEDFMQAGGMPENLKLKNDLILQELFNDIIIRDIVVRYNLKNPKLVKELALYLLSNIGKEFSFQKLKKVFNLGSVNTVISLISYYEDSYLLFTVPQFDYSFKRRIVNAKKIYAIDSGMIKVNSSSFSRDEGRILENVVFIHLKRMGKEVFYFKKNNECDFVARNAEKKLELYQVCLELNEDNKDREFNGLLEAMEYTNQKSGTIITLNQSDQFEINKKIINVLPAWKWLSENQNSK